MVNESRRLSTGSSIGARIVGAVFSLAFAAFGAVFAGGVLFLGGSDPFSSTTDCVITDLPPGVLPDCMSVCESWTLDRLGPIEIVGMLVGGAFVVLGLFAAFAAARGTAAWLDGTTLRVRRTFGTRAVDLSTADVVAGIVTHSLTGTDGRTAVRRIPTLEARDPASGRKVRLSLQGTSMDRIPPAELRALADAVGGGRPESLRVAQQLREMADDPLELSS